MSQLDRKYRPATFGDVTGQRPPTALLYLMTRNRDVPGAMLFYGKYGSGKTTLARITAKALNCQAPPGKPGEWPCGLCPSCAAIDAGNSPDVEEIDAASNGSVEQVRAICQRAQYGPTGDGYRVFLLDEAHGLSGPAFEHLLKTLEDPPPRVLFILLTTQPGSVPEPVQSRCSPFRFDPLSAAAIRGRLEYICQAEGFDAEPALLAAIAESAGGSVRDAVMHLDQVTRVGIGSLDMWRELTGESDYAPGLLAAAASGDYPAMWAAMDAALAVTGDPAQVTRELSGCLRDLLTLSCGGEVPAQGRGLEVRLELLACVGKARAAQAMAVLWDLVTRVRAEDRAMSLQLALAAVSRRLCQAPPEPIDRAGSGPASLADLKTALEGV